MKLELPPYSRTIARATRWCIRHTWATFAGTLAVLIAAALMASSLKVDPSLEAYLKGSDSWATYDEIDRTFNIGETVVIAFRETGGTVFDAETVKAVANLDRTVATMPGVQRVLSVASASVLGLNEGNGGAASEVIDVGPLLPAGPVTKDSAVILGERILAHPIYRQILIDERHETTFLLVQFDAKVTDAVARLQSVREIRREADRFQTKQRSVHVAGTPVTKEALATGVRQDIMYFFPTALVLLMLLLWIMFGDFIASVIPIVVVGFSSVLVVGTLAMAGVPLSMATATIPTIILAVGLADSVHFLAELRRQSQRIKDRETALTNTVEALSLPCLLTSATSAVGFFALVSSGIAPLRYAGWGAAIGLLAAYLCSMLLTPVLLNAFGYPKRHHRPFVAAPRLADAMTNLATRLSRQLFVPVSLVGLAVGGCVAALTQLQIDADFIDYLDENHRLRRDLQVIEKTLGGANTLEIIVDGGSPGAFLEPDNIRKVDALGKALVELDEVPGVFGFVDYLAFANAVMTGDPDPHRLPDQREAVSQIMLLNEDVFASLITPDNQRVRMTVATPTRPTESMLAFTDKLEQRAHRVLEGTGLSVVVTGLPSLFARVVRHLVRDALTSFGLAVLLIWLAMIAGFRSLKLATVAMLPNVLPVGLTFASMVVLGMSFDTNSAFIACMGLGIAVDDTIHIVTRYQRAKAHGAPSPRAALHYALTNAGHPVVMTSIMLMVGFAVLCLSSFAPTFRVGLLSMLLIAMALFFDLCVFPALLIVADRVGEFRSETRARPSSISGYVSNLTSLLTENQAPARPDSTTDEEEWQMPAGLERMSLSRTGSRS